MSKITFRADDDLVSELEAFDASKSEVMRDALRTYLEDRERDASPTQAGEPTARTDSELSIDDRVRELVDERLGRQSPQRESQDINVTVALEGDGTIRSGSRDRTGDRDRDRRREPSTHAHDDARDGTARSPHVRGDEYTGDRTHPTPNRSHQESSRPPVNDVSRGRERDQSGDRHTSVEERKTDLEGRSDDHQCGQCGETLGADHVYCPNCGEKASRRVFCECGDEVRSDWSFCPGCGRRTPAAGVLDSR